ncbi:PQQ-dependent sugar dehydrogenase [Jannaschia pohangensis]|uniref:Glucose/arabinose dehydrogenase, beta-propeller fold n=1 Tax=Jannaschia pohangensis TaxID=390807 RepID=A0A1I3IFJ2_9RHOB|nr:PQQ-dependent sugar dehydrogenase [Jannaschia pohangensis]SFI46660.1 Glucose/arabinose dehydrogenase, beta-propeller fold [Jannaschia pohangensis]
MQKTIISFICAAGLSVPACAQGFTYGARNTDFPPAFPEQFRAPLIDSDVELRTEVLADGLVNPWGIATLPEGGGWLVTERAGRLRHLAADGTLHGAIEGVPEVLAERQGGMLDVVLAPDFAESRVIYLTYAKPLSDGSATAAARMTLSDDMARVEGVEDIFVQSPPSQTAAHYGSRILPLPDGTLAITAGEHFTEDQRQYAQDLDKTYGKVLRVNPDGSVPAGNPFDGSPVWSLGHRNPQGAAIDAAGDLWTIEHGPQGGDELNRPEAGKNYGWPVISYGQNYNGSPIGPAAAAEGFEQPVYFWDPVIAPGGMAFHDGEMFADWNGDLLIGSLNPGGVVRLRLEDGMVVEEERLLMDLGRVRDVEILADGSFLVLTDYPDGEVVRVTPEG